jgi:hypothetical protein
MSDKLTPMPLVGARPAGISAVPDNDKAPAIGKDGLLADSVGFALGARASPLASAPACGQRRPRSQDEQWRRSED